MQALQDFLALILTRPGASRERTLRCSNRAPRILLIDQSEAPYDLTVGRSDNVHDLAAVGFNKRPIDLVRCACFHRGSL
jgi:hypothetical protein